MDRHGGRLDRRHRRQRRRRRAGQLRPQRRAGRRRRLQPHRDDVRTGLAHRALQRLRAHRRGGRRVRERPRGQQRRRGRSTAGRDAHSLRRPGRDRHHGAGHRPFGPVNRSQLDRAQRRHRPDQPEQLERHAATGQGCGRHAGHRQHRRRPPGRARSRRLVQPLGEHHRAQRLRRPAVCRGPHRGAFRVRGPPGQQHGDQRTDADRAGAHARPRRHRHRRPCRGRRRQHDRGHLDGGQQRPGRRRRHLARPRHAQPLRRRRAGHHAGLVRIQRRPGRRAHLHAHRAFPPARQDRGRLARHGQHRRRQRCLRRQRRDQQHHRRRPAARAVAAGAARSAGRVHRCPRPRHRRHHRGGELRHRQPRHRAGQWPLARQHLPLARQQDRRRRHPDRLDRERRRAGPGRVLHVDHQQRDHPRALPRHRLLPGAGRCQQQHRRVPGAQRGQQPDRQGGLCRSATAGRPGDQRRGRTDPGRVRRRDRGAVHRHQQGFGPHRPQQLDRHRLADHRQDAPQSRRQPGHPARQLHPQRRAGRGRRLRPDRQGTHTGADCLGHLLHHALDRRLRRGVRGHAGVQHQSGRPPRVRQQQLQGAGDRHHRHADPAAARPAGQLPRHQRQPGHAGFGGRALHRHLDRAQPG